MGVGALACAILVANNLRDIPTDAASGKRTLAVKLGDAGTRRLYAALLAAAAVALVPAVLARPWAALTFLVAPLAFGPLKAVLGGATGRDLLPVLRRTGALELAYGVVLGLSLAL